ncbi:hypothetical protein B4N89_45560 [Embleya scabrispora]|uniref:Uncharacterized protein n=1 Tax=Embleya scabrispora TaxID=159449 RepID=A0A1T3NIW7_9ACTN|nr:hypothetical protein B4N89_45560 [Embleya scabrispora]
MRKTATIHDRRPRVGDRADAPAGINAERRHPPGCRRSRVPTRVSRISRDRDPARRAATHR